MARIKWTDEALIEDAKRFSTRGEWQLYGNRSYQTALRRGLLDVCCAHMNQMRISWTDEMLIADAARFETRVEWQKKSKKGYDSALRRGLVDVCCAHMKQLLRKWTEADLIADAAQFETRTEWSNKSESAYKAASDRGLLDICCAHMKTLRKKWTNEMVMADASRFETRIDWKRNAWVSYNIAFRRNILDICAAHMKPSNGSDFDAVYIWKAIGWTFNGEQVYKVGVTSARLNEQRIIDGARAADAEFEIVIIANVNGKATQVESQLLAIGANPKYTGFNGASEFRAMSDEQLQQAINIIQGAMNVASESVEV